jgi:nucleoside-diphosphate-sugar epimerase
LRGEWAASDLLCCIYRYAFLNTKVIITGATGFIGKTLCRSLEDVEGYSVIPVTRSKKRPGFYCVGNYRDAPSGDILVHLGEDADRARVNRTGEAYRRETGEVADSLLGRGYENVIYCSSAVVYGDSGTKPYIEKMPVYPVDTYSQAKLENEKKFLNAGGSVVRLANVIGSGMAATNVLSDILAQLSVAGPVTVRNGRPIRDFIWVDDVVQALISLVQKQDPGIYNVGTGIGVSIKELAEMFITVAGKDQQEVNSMATSSGHSYNVVDIEKIKSTFGWSPTVTLSRSIRNLVDSI